MHCIPGQYTYNPIGLLGIIRSMIEIELAHFHMLITSAVLVAVFALFVREKIPTHLTAMGAMAVLLAFGVIETGDALSVFGNSAPITIAAIFILSASLQHTGVIDSIGYHMLKAAEKNRTRAVYLLMGGVICISAFVNNTPVVVILVPVVIAVARKLREHPSKYLIPLSYAAILGGTCTLIGTSTNLLVDGIAQVYDQPAFTLFEITLPGIIIAATGAIFLATIGRKLLPECALLEEELADTNTLKRFLAEAMISASSPLIGKTLQDAQFSEKANYEIVDLVRHDTGLRYAGSTNLASKMQHMLSNLAGTPEGKFVSALRDIPLMAGDRIIFKTDRRELLEIKRQPGISFDTEDMHLPQPISFQELTIAEGVVDKVSPFIGRTPASLRLRRRYGCYILAIHRGEQNITESFDELALCEGDVLLLEGYKDELEKLFETEKLLSLTQVSRRQFDRNKAPLAIGILATVVLLASMNIMPIAGLALIGAVAVLLTGCVNPQRAYEAIDWRVLMLIFGMLGLSIALERSGLAKIIVETVAGWVDDFGPLAVLAIIYLVASLFTEIMSNTATAALLTPIAIGLAQSLGVDPRPFIVAVMFGASASFATPIGYQTNTYVYRAGNYHFRDFLRIGVPMNILMLVVTIAVIPLFWEL